MGRLRSLWERYMHWRATAPPPPAEPAMRTPKADVDPEFLSRQTRALSMEPDFGG